MPFMNRSMLVAGALSIFLAGSLFADTAAKSVCLKFKSALDAYPHTRNEVVPVTFEHEKKSYSGCRVEFKTRWTLLGKRGGPQTLFYPFPDSAMYREGWRASGEADGPGMTGYRITKGKVFCLVDWYFEAGIDEATNKLVTGDDLSGRVVCAAK